MMKRMFNILDQRKIFKNENDKIIAGVCSGLGEYLRQPVWLVRGVTVLATWVFPLQLLATYLIAVAVLPPKALH